MNTELLEEIGLTKSEIKVYLALLEIGSSATGEIVNKSGASSSKIYEILDRLMQKGLVSYSIRSGTKYFEAADPKRIMDYMKEREAEINKQKLELKEMLPELELKRKISKYKTEATVFSGLKGAETAMNEVLTRMKKGEEYYLIGGVSSAWKPFMRFIKHYHERRAKKSIKIKILYSEAGKEWARDIKHLPHTEIRFGPTQFFTSSFILMYKDTTLIALPTKDDVNYFKIQNQEATDSFRAQFELLWEQDTFVHKGEDAVQQIFEEMLESGHCDFIAARGYFVDRRPDFIKDWERRAIRKGFTMRNIVDPDTKGHPITKFPFAETKYTLQKEFANLSVFWIYGDKVVISNWTEKEPIVVVIENKHVVDMYKKQFELLWQQDVATVKGIKGACAAWDRMLDELDEGEEYYVMGASWIGQTKEVYDFFKDFHKRRQEKGVKSKLLFVSSAKKLVEENKDSYKRLSEVKFLPKGVYEGIQFNLYKNKVLLFVWREKEPIIFTIDDNTVYNTFKTYFDTFWQQ